MAKPIEQHSEIITPIQPNEAINQAQMIAILRDKLNETIEVVNQLRTETIKLKKK